MPAVRQATSRKAREVAHPWLFRFNAKNQSRGTLLAKVAHPPYIHDLIHYTGHSLFRSEPRPADLQSFSQEFRDIAGALRSRMSVTDFKKHYEW